MFRIWSGPEGSSHKEPLSGIRIHRVRRRFLVPRLPASAGRALGVSLVLGFACGIARLPSALPAPAGSRPKPPEGSHLSEELNPVLFAARWRCLERGGYVVQETAALPFVFTSKEARFPRLGKRASFCLWACGLAETITAGGYFEFLRRRVAVAVIPRPAAATAASAIALGAASPVFASLPAVVSACLPLLEFACLVELGRASLPVAGEATGGVASAGCVEPEGGVVSVGFVISGEVALSAAAFASSYALQASS